MSREEKTCKWKYDEWHDYWDTECGEAYCLTTGTLEGSKHNFCPFCGGKIVEVKNERRSD